MLPSNDFGKADNHARCEDSIFENSQLFSFVAAVLWLEDSTRESFDDTRLPDFDSYSFENRESQLEKMEVSMNKLVPKSGGKDHPIYVTALAWGSGKTQLFTRGIAAHFAQRGVLKGFNCIYCYLDGKLMPKGEMLSGKIHDNSKEQMKS